MGSLMTSGRLSLFAAAECAASPHVAAMAKFVKPDPRKIVMQTPILKAAKYTGNR